MNIRHVTADDIAWIYETGCDFYRDINEADTLQELNAILHSPHSLFIRSDTAVFAGRMGANPYNRREVIMEDCFFFGLHVRKLLEYAMQWGKDRGATDFRFSLGYESKVKTLAPLAKRLGASPLHVELYNIALV